MQLRLSQDEAWSLMTVITSHIVDRSGISQDGKQAVRRWRNARAEGSPAMIELADGINGTLAAYLGEKLDRTIRRKGRYVKAKEKAR
jgi:hypothetical protein